MQINAKTDLYSGDCIVAGEERRFAGMLNSKSVYGQSYGDSESLRFIKAAKIYSLQTFNPIRYRKISKRMYPSWGKSLWNYGGEITFTQRQENFGRKKKRIELFRWRA